MWFHYCSLYSHQYGTECPCLPGRNMPVKVSSSLLLFSKFVVLVTCSLCFCLFEVHIQLSAAPTFSLPHVAWLAQQDTHVIRKGSLPNPLLQLWVWNKGHPQAQFLLKSAFLIIISSISLCSSLSSSSLPISSDFPVGICQLGISPCNGTSWDVSFHLPRLTLV